MKYQIHADITKAETLPSSFYQSDQVFELLREKVFAKTWHWVGERPNFQEKTMSPLSILEGFLKQPLLVTSSSDGELQCLANVCTHRANLLAQEPRKAKSIVCAYHGRQFDLKGQFQSMPEFEQAQDFPRECDHLTSYQLGTWEQFLFTAISPQFQFADFILPMLDRIGFLPIQEFQFRSELSKNYLVNAHWALYCDNYLEGFHIPFVHKDLNAVLDYSAYSTELFRYGSLQVGYADGGEEVFDLPQEHIDFGKNIAAYYFWLFPNMMFNFYPWGLSVNIVTPVTKDKTKVSFLTYVYDESKLEQGAGALLDKVEREDEYVVEGVHQGMQSSSYTTGRFSPTREKGVHHFHRLLAEFMNH
ncbi:MAG: Rieske 2Fe-2S domain-containing protein [Cyclobacteriaceae bacterium]